jgi:hypothetical protein
MAQEPYTVRTSNGNHLGSFARKSAAIDFAKKTYFESKVHTEVVHVDTMMVVYRTNEHNWESY